MNTYTNMYPIQKLITDRMQELGINRRDVATRMTYGKRSKAFAKFDHCMRTGFDPGPFFHDQLASVLQINVEVVREAFKQTWAAIIVELAVKERAVFTPHLWIDPENRFPSSILTVACLGVDRFRKTLLPEDIGERPFDEQKAFVTNAVQQDYKRRHGSTGLFGKILGYQYRITYDERWRVSVDGEFIEHIHGPQQLAPRGFFRL